MEMKENNNKLKKLKQVLPAVMMMMMLSKWCSLIAGVLVLRWWCQVTTNTVETLQSLSPSLCTAQFLLNEQASRL